MEKPRIKPLAVVALDSDTWVGGVKRIQAAVGIRKGSERGRFVRMSCLWWTLVGPCEH
jgi:hypothetical protein